MSKKKWLSLIQMLAPIILTSVKPELAPIAGNVSSAIQEAEQIKGATGADKLQHVQNIAHAAADSVNTAVGKEVVHIPTLDNAIQDGVSTVVSVANLVHGK